MREISTLIRSGIRRKPPGACRNRATVVAAFLCLYAGSAQAGENPSAIPVYSDADGARAWIEVTRDGNRSKAVPSLEIPRETILGSSAEDPENGLSDLSAGNEPRAPKGRLDVGKFLERHKSLVVREGPEGVSLGNAFDLVGEIRDALESGKTRQEKIRAVSGALRRASPDEATPRKRAVEGESPVMESSGYPADPATVRVRSSHGGGS